MRHIQSLPSSSSVIQQMLRLFLLLLLPSSSDGMTSSRPAVPLWRHGNRIASISTCSQLETPGGGLTVVCSGQRLSQVPDGLSNRTTRLFLNKNLLSLLKVASFSHLFLLDELDLSHNKLSSLQAGCFSGLESSLRFLDLSYNQLSKLEPAVFGGLQVQANLTHNHWYCDCSMQLAVPQLNLDSSSLVDVVCQTSELPNLGAVGLSLVLLLEDWDLCRSVRRTSDILTLVTMFLWFVMLISYFLYYIRQNEAVARRHFDYLHFLHNRDPFNPYRAP